MRDEGIWRRSEGGVLGWRLFGVSEDESVVHEEIEEAGEAECEQVAPDYVPAQQDGEELEKHHLDDETADAAAEIADVMPPI